MNRGKYHRLIVYILIILVIVSTVLITLPKNNFSDKIIPIIVSSSFRLNPLNNKFSSSQQNDLTDNVVPNEIIEMGMFDWFGHIFKSKNKKIKKIISKENNWKEKAKINKKIKNNDIKKIDKKLKKENKVRVLIKTDNSLKLTKASESKTKVDKTEFSSKFKNAKKLSRKKIKSKLGHNEKVDLDKMYFNLNSTRMVKVKQITSKYKVIEVDKSELNEILDNPSIQEMVMDIQIATLTNDSIQIIKSDVVNNLVYLGQGQKICVLDTGLNASALNLVEGVNLFGHNFLNDDSNYSDVNGHGTAVTYPITKVAPDATYYFGKVLNDNGSGYSSDVVAGLEWCQENNVDVVSMSLGGGSFNGYCDDDVLASKVNELVNAGIIVIAASGNDGSSTNIVTPACASKAIPVIATDKNDKLAYFSSYNNATILTSPGVDITTITNDGNYVTLSGTSMSVPFVSGVSALILENRTMSPSEMKELLIHTGDVINFSGRQFSRVNAYNALINNITNNLTYFIGNSTNGTNGSIETLTTTCEGAPTNYDICSGSATSLGTYSDINSCGSACESNDATCCHWVSNTEDCYGSDGSKTTGGNKYDYADNCAAGSANGAVCSVDSDCTSHNCDYDFSGSKKRCHATASSCVIDATGAETVNGDNRCSNQYQYKSCSSAAWGSTTAVPTGDVCKDGSTGYQDPSSSNNCGLNSTQECYCGNGWYQCDAVNDCTYDSYIVGFTSSGLCTPSGQVLVSSDDNNPNTYRCNTSSTSSYSDYTTIMDTNTCATNSHCTSGTCTLDGSANGAICSVNSDCASNNCDKDFSGSQRCHATASSCVIDATGDETVNGDNRCSNQYQYKSCSSGSWSSLTAVPTGDVCKDGSTGYQDPSSASTCGLNSTQACFCAKGWYQCDAVNDCTNDDYVVGYNSSGDCTATGAVLLLSDTNNPGTYRCNTASTTPVSDYTTIMDENECATNSFCSSGTCTNSAGANNGDTCSIDGDCNSGNCDNDYSGTARCHATASSCVIDSSGDEIVDGNEKCSSQYQYKSCSSAAWGSTTNVPAGDVCKDGSTGYQSPSSASTCGLNSAQACYCADDWYQCDATNDCTYDQYYVGFNGASCTDTGKVLKSNDVNNPGTYRCNTGSTTAYASYTSIMDTNECSAGNTCAAGTCGGSYSFSIKDTSGNLCMSVNTDGEFFLDGTFTGETTPSAPANSWALKNPTSSTITYVDSSCDMESLGYVYPNQASISAGSNEFIIKRASDSAIVFKITSAGDIYSLGDTNIPLCTANGASCTYGGDCCSGTCVAGTCRADCSGYGGQACSDDSSNTYSGDGACTNMAGNTCDEDEVAQFISGATYYYPDCSTSSSAYDTTPFACDYDATGGYSSTGVCARTSSEPSTYTVNCDSTETAKTGSYTYSDCYYAYTSGSTVMQCDTSNSGSWSANGICAVGLDNTPDSEADVFCDTNSACYDGSMYRNSLNYCVNLDSCDDDVSDGAYSQTGIVCSNSCVGSSSSDCCTDDDCNSPNVCHTPAYTCGAPN